jgi:hypothetical protein
VKDLSTTSLLGYSTKRLSKVGTFGLAKSLLATGVDFYTVTSRYKEEYSFHVQNHVVSAIAKFEDDIVNEVEIFFEALITSILCTIKQKNLTELYRNRGKTP